MVALRGPQRTGCRNCAKETDLPRVVATCLLIDIADADPAFAAGAAALLDDENRKCQWIICAQPPLRNKTLRGPRDGGASR